VDDSDGLEATIDDQIAEHPVVRLHKLFEHRHDALSKTFSGMQWITRR
jgi:hypothetical protein